MRIWAEPGISESFVQSRDGEGGTHLLDDILLRQIPEGFLQIPCFGELSFGYVHEYSLGLKDVVQVCFSNHPIPMRSPLQTCCDRDDLHALSPLLYFVLIACYLSTTMSTSLPE